jgi:hypothetical protein
MPEITQVELSTFEPAQITGEVRQLCHEVKKSIAKTDYIANIVFELRVHAHFGSVAVYNLQSEHYDRAELGATFRENELVEMAPEFCLLLLNSQDVKIEDPHVQGIVFSTSLYNASCALLQERVWIYRKSA